MVTSASAVHEMTAPVANVLSTVKSLGAAQLGHVAVIVPATISFSDPSPTIVPDVSRIS